VFRITYTVEHAWSRRLVTGLLQRRPLFDPMSVCVRFVADWVATAQNFLRLLQPSPVSIIPAVLYNYSSSSTCFCYQKDKRAKPGNLPKGNVIRGALYRKVVSLWVFKRFNSIHVNKYLKLKLWILRMSFWRQLIFKSKVFCDAMRCILL